MLERVAVGAHGFGRRVVRGGVRAEEGAESAVDGGVGAAGLRRALTGGDFGRPRGQAGGVDDLDGRGDDAFELLAHAGSIVARADGRSRPGIVLLGRCGSGSGSLGEFGGGQWARVAWCRGAGWYVVARRVEQLEVGGLRARRPRWNRSACVTHRWSPAIGSRACDFAQSGVECPRFVGHVSAGSVRVRLEDVQRVRQQGPAAVSAGVQA